MDKTSGPSNIVFKGLKEKWLELDANSKSTIIRFDWDDVRGSWLEEQASGAIE